MLKVVDNKLSVKTPEQIRRDLKLLQAFIRVEGLLRGNKK